MRILRDNDGNGLLSGFQAPPIQCAPVDIVWTAGATPYTLTVNRLDDTANPLVTYQTFSGLVDPPQFLWTADVPGESAISLTLVYGDLISLELTAPTIVQSSNNTSCFQDNAGFSGSNPPAVPQVSNLSQSLNPPSSYSAAGTSLSSGSSSILSASSSSVPSVSPSSTLAIVHSIDPSGSPSPSSEFPPTASNTKIPPSSSQTLNSGANGSSKTGLVVGISVGAVVLVSLMMLAMYLFRRMRTKKRLIRLDLIDAEKMHDFCTASSTAPLRRTGRNEAIEELRPGNAPSTPMENPRLPFSHSVLRSSHALSTELCPLPCPANRMKTPSFPLERDGHVVTAVQEEDGGIRLAGGRSDESRHTPPPGLLRHPTLPPAYREF